jgi:UDP-N-acetyl-D-galactosamine dehydrogenase
VLDIQNELTRMGVEVDIYDPLAHADEIEEDFKRKPTPFEKMQAADCVILAAPHSVLKTMIVENADRLFKNPRIFIDIKGVFEPNALCSKQDQYWRL